jgi:hypothetical protein
MSRPVGAFPAKGRGSLAGLLGVAGLSGLLGLACVEQQEEKPSAEDQEYVKKNLLSAAPTPQFKVDADLDGKVTFLGLDVTPNPIEPGRDVKVVQYWKVISPPGEGWRMFSHVSGPNNAGYQNRDHGPLRGKYPVAQWKAGDIVRDEFAFSLPASWQLDHVEIYVGLWRHNENMAVKSGSHDARNRVLAATVPVKRAGPPPAPKKYLVRKTSKPIKIDGKLDEASWKSAPSVGAFVDTMTGLPNDVKTDAKLLWDDQNLYIAFENTDSDVWGTLTKRDDKLWTQEADEVMIDADGNGKTYIELQVAPNGTIFDAYLPEFRKYEDTIDGKRKPFDWNSKVKASVKVDGTLNKRGDQDKGWVVELALPLADVNGLATAGVKVPPAYGDTWRVNMFRLDAPQGKGQQAAAWSPPLVGDFHVLDRFGQIVFADDKGDVPAPAAAPATAAAAKAESLKGRRQAIEEGLKGVHGGKAGAENGALKLEGHRAPASVKSKGAKGDGESKKK